jgi:hypothetical protein
MADYLTVSDVIKTAGLGNEVFGENLGAGDDSETSFDLANPQVISSTYSLYYGASGSNDFTSLTETTHYTINLDLGTIELTDSGVTELGTNDLYADYIHSPKVSDSIVSGWLDDLEEELESLTGNYWGDDTTTTKVFDGRETPAYPTTNSPYVTDYDDQDIIQLNNKAVASITSVKFLAQGSGADRVIDSSAYTFNENGRIVFYSEKLPVGKANVEVVYVHGYTTGRPKRVVEAASLIGAIKAFAYITGGSYDEATSYTLGRKAVTIGEQYVNIAQTIKNFEDRLFGNRDKMRPGVLDKLGRDFAVVA